MGVKALRHFSQIIKTTELTDSEYRVLHTLALLHPDDQSEVRVSAALIMQKAGRGLCRRSMFYALGHLEHQGLIARQVTRGKVTCYHFPTLHSDPKTSATRALVTSANTALVNPPTSATLALDLVQPLHTPCKNMKKHEEKKYKETSAADTIFEYWQKVMGHPTAKFTADRKRKVVARLREGYTPDEICQAIDGCKASAWHQGENPDGKVYDNLASICGNGSKLEMHINHASKQSKPPAPLPPPPDPATQTFYFDNYALTADPTTLPNVLKRRRDVLLAKQTA